MKKFTIFSITLIAFFVVVPLGTYAGTTNMDKKIRLDGNMGVSPFLALGGLIYPNFCITIDYSLNRNFHLGGYSAFSFNLAIDNPNNGAASILSNYTEISLMTLFGPGISFGDNVGRNTFYLLGGLNLRIQNERLVNANYNLDASFFDIVPMLEAGILWNYSLDIGEGLGWNISLYTPAGLFFSFEAIFKMRFSTGISFRL